MNRPLSLLFVLVSALHGAGCIVQGSDDSPCDPNPCTEPNRSVCVEEGGDSRCLCEAGFIARPSGACEPLGPSNCAEHAGDAAEPDDCQARAQPISSSSPSLQQSIDPIGDYDFFQFSTFARELYSVSVQAQGSLLPRVDVFDQGGVWVTAAEAPGRVDLFFKARVSSPHFARVSHSPVDPSVATGGYTLSFKSLGREDHGDFPEEATSISPDPASTTNPSSFTGRFDYPRDQDWFRFEGDVGRNYRIFFDSSTGRVVPAVAVFAGGNLRQPLFTSLNATISFSLPADDTVFIVLDPPQASGGSTYAFNFLVN
ncbi:hypothetical protein [Hyalangium sp.]|uniref:hypothetical protein n=1 Tax=Hyalangium sp. TaxID=2028555 RepID=UPI002D4C86A9|nr:hypothetical protein [Hyalangium sp.]HYI03089.1 hypothetical protein [Hyalangium sp.]